MATMPTPTISGPTSHPAAAGFTPTTIPAKTSPSFNLPTAPAKKPAPTIPTWTPVPRK